MADDPRQPPDDRGVDGDRGAPEGRPQADAPSPPPSGAGPDDATRVGEPIGQPGAADATRTGDTVRQPGAADATAPIPPREPAWSGRAGVPPRGSAPPRQPQPDWSYDPEPDDRRWWMPILVGTVAVILLGVLVVAGWAIVDSARRDTPRSPSPVLTTPAAPTAPTTGPPTTAASTPSATPSVTTGAPVLLPPLVGLSQQEAVAELGRLGLVALIEPRISARPPGTVLDTEPSTGTEVEPGSEVILVVAEPPTSLPTTPPGPTGPTGPTPDG
ncbi:PASTA domain-containing protein [Plantactinospora sp. ZYX-F-223]|uniref:Stk1 family PASTA domain-containing Ser/Thr kinase n=1 Tax=Plantactinospora sp. ZYX-F-223 TaxID=3144103 RepID=UPI0031FC4906